MKSYFKSLGIALQIEALEKRERDFGDKMLHYSGSPGFLFRNLRGRRRYKKLISYEQKLKSVRHQLAELRSRLQGDDNLKHISVEKCICRGCGNVFELLPGHTAMRCPQCCEKVVIWPEKL